MEIMSLKNEVATNITNPHLRLATRRIYTIGEKIRKCSFEVASIVASVEDTKTYKDDFKKSSEWAEKVFGFKRSTFFNMLKLGREWVSVDSHPTTEGSNVMVHNYHSILVKECEDDYSVHQIVTLFPIGVPAAVELHNHGFIKPTMTVKELREVVSKYLEEAEEVETEAEEVETEAEEVETEAEEVETEAEEVEVLEPECYTHDAKVTITPADSKVTITVGGIVYEFTLEEWAAHTNIEKTAIPAKQ